MSEAKRVVVVILTLTWVMLVLTTMETNNVEKMKKIQKKTMSGTVMLLTRNLEPLGSLLPKAAEPF